MSTMRARMKKRVSRRNPRIKAPTTGMAQMLPHSGPWRMASADMTCEEGTRKRDVVCEAEEIVAGLLASA